MLSSRKLRWGGGSSPNNVDGSGDPNPPNNVGGNDNSNYMNFDNERALKLIKADIAYANLEAVKVSGLSSSFQASTIRPGAGITIGLIDSGIDTQHPVFAGVSVEEQVLSSDYTDEINLGFSHGTAVASVIAAAPQTSGVLQGHRFRGISWGAQIKMYAIELSPPPDSPDPLYEPSNLSILAPYDMNYASLFKTALNDRLDILNLSFAQLGLIGSYNEQSLRTHLSHRISAMAQTSSSDKTILVWAAGNSNGYRCRAGSFSCPNGRLNASSPEFNAGLAVYIPELRGHSVAVVSVDSDTGVISYFSNRCGVAKNWCIAAPGGNISFAYSSKSISGNVERDIGKGSGTSYAAPFVSGGLAIMKQIFRGQLSNTALLKRLYDTANKTGRYAKQNIYGQGLMDLGKATSPQGQQTLATGNTVGDGGVNLLSTKLSTGSAFGDGLQQGLAQREIVAFDNLGAPFWYKLSSFVEQRQASHHLPDRLRQWNQKVKSRAGETTTLSFASDLLGSASNDNQAGKKLKIGLLQTKPNLDIGQLSLAENALGLSYQGSDRISLSAYTTLPTRKSLPIAGLALAWRMRSTPLAFRVAGLRESESVLGLQSEGAFGDISSNSITAGVASGFNLFDWHIKTEAEIGRATPNTSGGVISGMGTALTTGFAIHGTKLIDRNKRLTLGITQSMRMEKSILNLTVPSGRTKDGKVVRSDISASIKPTGRQVDLSLNWEHETSAVSGFMLEGVYRRNAGHSASSPPGFLFTAGWRQQF